jgi:uncharacterized membrane protein
MYGNYGGAIFVMAVGAIMKFAVTGHVSGISIATIGVIPLLAGVVWLVLALVFDLSARRRGAPVAVERERVVEADPRVW